MKKVYIRALLVLLLFYSAVHSVYADEIYLKNGDRVSGKIIKEDNDAITVQTEAMGMVSIKRSLTNSHDTILN